MHQLVMHLLTNAVQHTTQGCITIKYEHERNGLAVTISDTGCGISKQFKENLFSMLHNENALTLANQASGLGLSICKAITDSLRGEINITSEENKGTVAKFWFPCRMRDMDKDKL
jgi:signal transduction histidine kinase